MTSGLGSIRIWLSRDSSCKETMSCGGRDQVRFLLRSIMGSISVIMRTTSSASRSVLSTTTITSRFFMLAAVKSEAGGCASEQGGESYELSLGVHRYGAPLRSRHKILHARRCRCEPGGEGYVIYVYIYIALYINKSINSTTSSASRSVRSTTTISSRFFMLAAVKRSTGHTHTKVSQGVRVTS